jgi:isopenicillin N synthase-like dioxygenase
MSGSFPVIDIGALQQPQVAPTARSRIARQVASASEEIGFFAVTGHGVPGAVIVSHLPVRQHRQCSLRPMSGESR